MKTLPANIQEAKQAAENILKENNISYSFSGMSDTNGLSVYFYVGDVKVRFSDHTITNRVRMNEEVCFYFGGNEFSLTQSLFRLLFENGDESVEYAQIDYVRGDGKVLKAFGYKKK